MVLIKLHEVILLTRRSKSSINADIKNGTFPPSIKIGKRSVAWKKADIDAWIQSKIAAMSRTEFVVGVRLQS